MAVANLVLSYLKALVWPLVVLILTSVFRSELKGLFGRVSSVDAAGASVKFSEVVMQATKDLIEVREESRTVRVRRPLLPVAAAARSVLDAYPIWPQVENGLLTPPAETLREVFLVVGDLVNRTVDAFYPQTAAAPAGAPPRDPFPLLDQLSHLTGVSGWKKATDAIKQVLWLADGLKDGTMPPSRITGFIGFLLTGKRNLRKLMGAHDVDMVVRLANSAMQTIQELLEATELAHRGGTQGRDQDGSSRPAPEGAPQLP